MNSASTRWLTGLIFCIACNSFGTVAQRVRTPVQVRPNSQDPGDCAYHFVEQMPRLPEGGGLAAIGNKIGELVKSPLIQPLLPWSRTIVYFVVGSGGNVYREKILKSSGVPAYDHALLVAVRALPRLVPGYHNGVAVSVGLTVPIQIEVH